MSPDFYYDAETERVMFACEHQAEPSTLPSAIWKVLQVEPLTVMPSVWNTSCGCHGFIRAGEWVAA